MPLNFRHPCQLIIALSRTSQSSPAIPQNVFYSWMSPADWSVCLNAIFAALVRAPDGPLFAAQGTFALDRRAYHDSRGHLKSKLIPRAAHRNLIRVNPKTPLPVIRTAGETILQKDPHDVHFTLKGRVSERPCCMHLSHRSPLKSQFRYRVPGRDETSSMQCN